MAIDSVEDSSVPGEGSFLKATTESSTGGDVVSARQQSSETISKEATSLLAVCTTLRQLDHLRRWYRSNSASSPLCVRVRVDVAT
jgi:hypothetical protein